MKESYVEGSSDPPRPRVMAACPQGSVASVDRGTRRSKRSGDAGGAGYGASKVSFFRSAEDVPLSRRQHRRHCYRETPKGPARESLPGGVALSGGRLGLGAWGGM